jgi:two-component system sensor histidine kinase FlrB
VASSFNPAIERPDRGEGRDPEGDARLDLLAGLLERRDRLSAMGEMTARLAHQVRTPLASALLYASQLETTAPRQKVVVEKLTRRLTELGRMIEEMLGFARGAQPGSERISVANLLDDVADMFAAAKTSGSLSVVLAHRELAFVGDGESIKGALANLVCNALEAGAVSPRVELGAEYRGERAWLTVTDNGPGIPAEILPRLFEPFFTTRPQGTGLGLAIVHAVAEAHGGEVLVDSGPHGTTFALCLPVSGATR